MDKDGKRTRMHEDVHMLPRTHTYTHVQIKLLGPRTEVS